MALREYNVRDGRRGNVDTTMLLSDEDAKARGLTQKDLVSKTDQSVSAFTPEFKPQTEADLDPGAAQAAADALEAAKREEARVAAEAAERVKAAEAEVERIAAAEKEREAAAEKQAKAAQNKQAKAAQNKAAAPADGK